MQQSKLVLALVCLMMVVGCFVTVPMVQAEDAREVDPKLRLVIPATQQVVLNPHLTGLPIGTQVPNVVFTSIDHKGYQLLDYRGNKVFLYFQSHGSLGSSLFFPLLNDWANQYHGQMDFIVISDDSPVLNHPYITFGVNGSEVREEFQTRTGKFFLINEEGVIDYHGSFQMEQWAQLDQLMTEYVTDGSLPEGTPLPDTALKNQPLPAIARLETLKGKQVDLTAVENGLIYIFSPGVPACEAFRPHLNQIMEKYAGRLDMFYVVPGMSGDLAYSAKQDYVNKYHIPYTPKPQIDKVTDLNQQIATYDQAIDIVLDDHDLTLTRWGLSVIPTLLLIKDGQVLSGYALEMGYGEGLIDPLPEIEQKIAEILQ